MIRFANNFQAKSTRGTTAAASVLRDLNSLLLLGLNGGCRVL